MNALSLMRIKGRNMLQRTRGRQWQRAPFVWTPKHRRLHIQAAMSPSSKQSVIQHLMAFNGTLSQDMLLATAVIHTSLACFVFPNAR